VIQIEPEWVVQARKGNSESFCKLVEAFQTPVYNLCNRMLGNPYEAEDAAQETFLRAFNNIRHYDENRPFSTWLLSIAAHYCIDQIRKRRMNILSLDETVFLDPPDGAPGPETALSTVEEQKRVRVVLEKLVPQDRVAVIMLYWYDFSYEEIAEALSMTVSAVKSRLHRARQTMAQTWSEQEASVKAKRRQNDHAQSPAF
jgi:RNA polymerase sigma-70 factor, ECF subfamily